MNFRFAIFICTMIAFGYYASIQKYNSAKDSNSKINLALRRTAHLLLLESGDSTSIIDPVLHSEENIWIIPLNNFHHYEKLPTILQSSLNLHQINNPYNVQIIKCTDQQIILGYNYKDVLNSSNTPCVGRELKTDCYQLKIEFLSLGETPNRYYKVLILFLAILLLATILFWPKLKKVLFTQQISETTDSEVIFFGNSSLHISDQLFKSSQHQQKLTYRETKLLHLFLLNQNKILERNIILSKVWSDEGILVSRSLDMFVSRLRKILRHDPSVQISAIHGIGYKLEVN